MNFSLYNYYRYLNSPCAPLAARAETAQAAELYRHQDAAGRHTPALLTS